MQRLLTLLELILLAVESLSPEGWGWVGGVNGNYIMRQLFTGCAVDPWVNRHALGLTIFKIQPLWAQQPETTQLGIAY